MSREERIAALGWDRSAQPDDPVDACNLCGSARLVEVSRTDRYGYPQPLRVCARCGLGFLSPRLTAEAYGAFYDDVYRPLVSAYHGRRIDAETVQDDQRPYAAELVAFLQRTLERPPESILDIGGSTGVVAVAARDAFGAQATVLDPAPDELAVAERLGLETIAGFAEDLEAGDRRWELVLLCQTIDHLLDVTGTLRILRGLLADGGRLFVDVLDVTWVLARVGQIEGAVKVDHPFYLSRATALAFFARAGLDVVAERMADDGHWGFVLAAGEPQPDALPAGGDAFLAEVWRGRAERR